MNTTEQSADTTATTNSTANTTPLKPVAIDQVVLPTYEKLLKAASQVTMEDYSGLLDQVAFQTTCRPALLDDIKRQTIIQEIVNSPYISVTSRPIAAALTQIEKQMKADQPEDDTDDDGQVLGGYGKYYLQPASTLVQEAGVYVFRKNQFGGFNGKSDYVCSPLSVTAETYDTHLDNRGLRLEWKDTRGRVKQWTMPLVSAAGDGLEVIKKLKAMGLFITTGCEKLVIDYINATSQTVGKELLCTDKTGWQGDSFVTPEKTYGGGADKILFQTQHAVETGYGQKGTLKEWQQHIASKAVGNPRLMLALSAGFAGALLNKSEMSGFGVHFWGGSSIGKTTLLLMASSIWGRPKRDSCGQGGYMHQWLGTAVSFEGIACAHNDGLLVLDEIGEATSKTVAATAYMLGNGITKSRGNRDGNTKPVKHFKVVFLSSGEHTLDQMMKAEGGTTRAGQEIRMVNLNADAGEGLGIFNTLHDSPDGAALAVALNEVTGRYYGVAGAEWLKAITGADGLPDDISRAVVSICDGMLPDNASGQVRRVARQFALIAYAGMLATRHGITGWKEEDSISAAKVCFNDWLADFGDATGQREHTQIIESVHSFFVRDGSKFQSVSAVHPIPDRVGWIDSGEDNGTEYLIPPSEIGRLAKGYSKGQIINALNASGMLGNNGKSVQKWFGGRNNRVYVIQPGEDTPDF